MAGDCPEWGVWKTPEHVVLVEALTIMLYFAWTHENGLELLLVLFSVYNAE